MKPTYIHTIGIEGCGHHFWWTYLDQLLSIVAKERGNVFYNNLHKDNNDEKKNIEIKTAVKPVLPPSSIPAPDSI